MEIYLYEITLNTLDYYYVTGRTADEAYKAVVSYLNNKGIKNKNNTILKQARVLGKSEEASTVIKPI
jgi:hypothetical protein